MSQPQPQPARPPVGRVEQAAVVLTAAVMLLAAAAFVFNLLRINYVATPLDEALPRPPFAGITTATLTDGTEVTVATRGYRALTPEQRAAHAPLTLRVRGFRPDDERGQTQLWVNALDADGRAVLELDQDAFEVYEGERLLPRVHFNRLVDQTPPSFAPPFIWIANSVEGTVSKLSTRTGEELGRYKVPGNPSRTSVDLDGNVYVATRDAATVVKIQAHGCQGDACVLYTRPTCVGARGLAVDAQGRVWIGGASTSPSTPEKGCLQQIDGRDGRLLFERQDLDGPVYGLAIDQRGSLWAVHPGLHAVARFTRTGRADGRWKTPEASVLYGIAVDVHGQIWLGNHKKKGLWRFDPGDERWDYFNTPASPETRGVAADVAGHIWAASSDPPLVSKFNARTGEWLGDFETGGLHPVGVAIDANQFVWVINRDSDSAVKLDPDSGQQVGLYKVGSGPYTYSDMTGYALNNFVASRGLYRLDYHRVPFRLRIAAPDHGAVVPAITTEARPLRARVDAFDPGDPVEAVTWWVDGVKVGTVAQPPFGLDWEAREIADGWHDIRAEGHTRAGFTDDDEVKIQAVRTFGQVRVEVMRHGQRLAALPRTVELVIDSSGSMWGLVEGERKIDAARQALLDVVRALPEETAVGLRAYGHRSMRCDDSQRLVAPGPPGRDELSDRILGLRPRGRTPIAHSLQLAGADLKAGDGEGFLGERMVVLVTDGIETCQGDPCAAAAELARARLRVNVIGFGLERGVDRSSLRCMAEATGGIYADAGDSGQLVRELERAVQISWEVVDEGGNTVHTGALKRPRAVLPPGVYKVRFGARGDGRRLESEPFTLETDQRLTVRLALQDGGPPQITVVPEPTP